MNLQQALAEMHLAVNTVDFAAPRLSELGMRQCVAAASHRCIDVAAEMWVRSIDMAEDELASSSRDAMGLCADVLWSAHYRDRDVRGLHFDLQRVASHLGWLVRQRSAESWMV